tara:strand:+ start:75240 stop:75842 length:603 start_codon:yes stop_codon:yes gene_type:complete
MKISVLDLLGASLSLSSTYYFTKAARLAWLIGITAIILNSILYWQKCIFGHLILEGIYLISMLVGLWRWRLTNTKNNQIKQLSYSQCLWGGSLSICFIYIVAQCLVKFTASPVPVLDAITTVLSLVAQLLLVYKFLQCWILWFVVDAIMAVMQFSQGMPFHAVATTFYLVLAILGYKRWQKLFALENKGSNALALVANLH